MKWKNISLSMKRKTLSSVVSLPMFFLLLPLIDQYISIDTNSLSGKSALQRIKTLVTSFCERKYMKFSHKFSSLRFLCVVRQMRGSYISSNITQGSYPNCATRGTCGTYDNLLCYLCSTRCSFILFMFHELRNLGMFPNRNSIFIDYGFI